MECSSGDRLNYEEPGERDRPEKTKQRGKGSQMEKDRVAKKGRREKEGIPAERTIENFC